MTYVLPVTIPGLYHQRQDRFSCRRRWHNDFRVWGEQWAKHLLLGCEFIDAETAMRID